MSLVAPVILKSSLIVLIESGMDPQSAVRVTGRMIAFCELAFNERLRIVLLCVRKDGGRIQFIVILRQAKKRIV